MNYYKRQLDRLEIRVKLLTARFELLKLEDKIKSKETPEQEAAYACDGCKELTPLSQTTSKHVCAEPPYLERYCEDCTPDHYANIGADRDISQENIRVYDKAGGEELGREVVEEIPEIKCFYCNPPSEPVELKNGDVVIVCEKHAMTTDTKPDPIETLEPFDDFPEYSVLWNKINEIIERINLLSNHE